MKIYAFGVSQPGKGAQVGFEEAVDYVHSLPYEDRYYSGMRLEAVKQQKNGTYKIDFTKLRNKGLPGKATKKGPTKSLGLANNEVVSEETAALFIPQNNVLLLQLNMYGPHRGLIENYMSVFAYQAAKQLKGTNGKNEGFDIGAKLNPSVQAQFNKFKLMRKLEFKVSVPAVSAANRQQGQSLGKVIDNGLIGGPRNAHVVLSAGRKKAASLDLGYVTDAIKYLRSGPGDVETLRVSGKEYIDSNTVVLDLVDAVLKTDKPVKPGDDRRLPQKDRWSALIDAYDEWMSDGVLP